MQNLSLTIKCNFNHFSNDTLDEIYKYVISYYKRILGVKLKASVYELDSKHKLHYHGHIQAPKVLSYKSFFIKGFRIYVKPITNLSGWMKYMYKSPHQCPETSHFNVRTNHQFSSTTALLDHLGTLIRQVSAKDITTTPAPPEIGGGGGLKELAERVPPP